MDSKYLEEGLMKLITDTAMELRHARATNSPKALVLTQDLAYLKDFLNTIKYYLNIPKVWVIRSIEYPAYFWTGGPYSGTYNGIDSWTSDASKSIRFCRQIDAEYTMVMQGFPKSEYICMEYQFRDKYDSR